MPNCIAKRKQMTQFMRPEKDFCYNFVPEVSAQETLPDKIKFREITMRQDWERGFVLPVESKILMAEALDELGVDGTMFHTAAHAPLATELEHVTAVIRECKNRNLKLKLGFLLFCWRPEEDVKKTADALIDSGVDEFWIECTIAPRRLDHAHLTRQQMIDKCVKWVEYAKSRGARVVSGVSTASEVEWEHLKDATTQILAADADQYHVSDSHSTLKPSAMKYLVRELKKFVKVPIEVHCHNDLGLGTALALAALEGGAEEVDCFINGNDPGHPMTPLEELVMALKILYNKETQIKVEKLTEVSRLFERLTGMKIASNKPIVGEVAFGASSVAILRNYTLSYPFHPALVGNSMVLRMGHFSGPEEVREKAKQLGIPTPKNLEKIVAMITTRAAKARRSITDEEFLDIVEEAA